MRGGQSEGGRGWECQMGAIGPMLLVRHAPSSHLSRLEELFAHVDSKLHPIVLDCLVVIFDGLDVVCDVLRDL